MITELKYCNPRLIGVGGVCPDHSDAIYSGDVPKKYSKAELINHGAWITRAKLNWDHEQQAALEHHHFS
eukprot:CAMPEP_0181290366 /NCGR_PEP_ID=MMETSP1101-20121128/1375_1 /TAXON_ID=46948 /ORGANISM="Rhodomonas abbreviata, Strain Caron Lab Isolate" /LENGTH=68 /DNA_ID=CAMNT_0023394645 /DNA_START=217 /DNA_END=423 /DNA_ORIENTATION=+